MGRLSLGGFCLAAEAGAGKAWPAIAPAAIGCAAARVAAEPALSGSWLFPVDFAPGLLALDEARALCVGAMAARGVSEETAAGDFDLFFGPVELRYSISGGAALTGM